MRVLPSLVNIDQISFMPGKSTDIIIHRVFMCMQIPSTDSAPVVFLLLSMSLLQIFWSVIILPQSIQDKKKWLDVHLIN